jgi:hypothetical protein
MVEPKSCKGCPFFSIGSGGTVNQMYFVCTAGNHIEFENKIGEMYTYISYKKYENGERINRCPFITSKALKDKIS